MLFLGDGVLLETIICTCHVLAIPTTDPLVNSAYSHRNHNTCHGLAIHTTTPLDDFCVIQKAKNNQYLGSIGMPHIIIMSVTNPVL